MKIPLRIELVVGLLLSSTLTQAATEGPGKDQLIPAVRATSQIKIDGRLDEAAWADAPTFDAFVQRFPVPGAAPSERTELRVTYDDRAVYFAIHAKDATPSAVDYGLTRRDSAVVSDAVHVLLDPTHDHRTAYLFTVSAGNVQSDGVFFDDRNFTFDWDAVWESGTQRTSDGWTAEIAIPLHLLRFPVAEVQTWGFSVRRNVFRRNEEIESVVNPRGSGGVASRIGHLTGLTGLQPKRMLELAPYLSTRGTLRPNAAMPSARLANPSADVGVDVRYSLTSDLNLTATLNPDFGQVEADQLLLNLTTFENFFPEKRPFFTQGLELFKPIGSEFIGIPHQIFYSRRIGLTAPILAAAKVTGSLAKGVEITALDAVVMGPSNAEDPARAEDRGLYWSAERPFHLGLRDELPTDPVSPTNYFASTVRSSVGRNSRVGGTFAAATPLTTECSEEDAALAAPPAACLARGGNALAGDFSFRTPDSVWGVVGQLSGSQQVGGPPRRILRDGTVLDRGELGYGAYVRGGRIGGDGFKAWAAVDYSSPTLDLNAAGFQRTQNELQEFLALQYHRNAGWGPLKTFHAGFFSSARQTTDGRGISRGKTFNVSISSDLPTFDFVGFETGIDFGDYSVREVANTGVPMTMPTNAWVVAWAGSNPNRPVHLFAVGVLRHRLAMEGLLAPRSGYFFEMQARVRPHPSIETSLSLQRERSEQGLRYVATSGDQFVFADQQANFMSLTLRQNFILSPYLSLQAYAQLFTAHAFFREAGYFSAPTTETSIEPVDLRPIAAGGPSGFKQTSLNLNLVLRWEYRLGSTLFLVYTRSQSAGEGRQSIWPERLYGGNATDTLLLKLSFYLSA